jgi:hypothetical protein
MPSNPRTPAHAEEHQRGSYLFKLADVDPISHIFEVADVPVVVKAFGLQDNDCVVVDMVIGAEGNEYFEAARLQCGCHMRMNRCRNIVAIGIAGRYRLRYTWPSTVPTPNHMGQFVVIQHKTNIQVSFNDMLGSCCGK